MFTGIEQKQILTTGTEIFLRIGGAGPPLLMLHGHSCGAAVYDVLATWREVAEDVCGHVVSGGLFCPKKPLQKR